MAWWSGTNEEFFTNGPCDTREQAIEELWGEGGYVVEAETMKIRFDAGRIIADQYFDCEDYFSGEYGEPERKGDHVAADAELQAFLDDWAGRWKDTFVQPEMFGSQGKTEFIPGTETADD